MSDLAAGPPVFAICGFKDSGKTSLLVDIVTQLRAEGLAVAAIKSDAHGLDVDHRGKDSDRLFQAGADVFVGGPDQSLARWHAPSNHILQPVLRMMSQTNDVVLVEGHKSSPWPKIWLDGGEGQPPPPAVRSIGLRLGWDDDRLGPAVEWIRERLQTAWRLRPCLGAVLIGGDSRRMGKLKQLLVHRGTTLSERSVLALSDHVEETFMVGGGELPSALDLLRRLPDPPGVRGPIAGVLAAMRWSPESTWVVAACDMPGVRSEAVAWLASHRRPGVWAVLPRSAEGKIEPTLALYEPQARRLLETQAAEGKWGPRHLVEHHRVRCPTPPADLEDAWLNVNTPEEMKDSGSSDV